MTPPTADTATEKSTAPGPSTSTPAHEARGEVDAVIDSGRAAKDAASALAASAGDTVRAATAVAKRQLAERPYTTIAVAAGVGFLVAGGFASPVGRRLVRWSARLAIGAATRQLTTVLADHLHQVDQPSRVVDDGAGDVDVV